MTRNDWKKIFLDDIEDEEYPDDRSNELRKVFQVSELILSMHSVVTYDGSKNVELAGRFVAVLRSILNKTTFEFIQVESQYSDYLTMIHWPVIIDHINWGASIRGAWFSSCDKVQDVKYLLSSVTDREDLKLDSSEKVTEFYAAIIELFEETALAYQLTQPTLVKG